ncbi:MAG TPA: antitoxin family protein [Lacipirellulaceae bacterium]
MSQDFRAVYENGVLRPLTPLSLPELTEVVGTLQEANGVAESGARSRAVELQRQQAALDAMFEEVDKLPQTARNDGLSGRDHDQILYGSRK